jgi:RND family efflux transporter MFP subunit
MQRKRIDRVTSAFAAGCGLIMALAGCGGGKKQAAPPPGVTVAEVVRETVPITMGFPGTLEAVRSVNIIPRVSGYIYDRYFVEGTYVERDDPLYLIDPRPFKADLDAAMAQLERDQANLVYWKSEEKRYTDLAMKGAGSEEKKETAVAKALEARAAVDQDRANIENAKLNLSFTNVEAPFRGRIQDTRFHVGALVEKQRDVLTTLVQMDPIYVIFNVSRNELYTIQLLQREGRIARDWTKIEAAVMLSDGSEYPHRGHVNFVSAQIDPATDTLMMRAVFPNPSEDPYDVDLVPGQFVPFRLILGENPDGLLIPKEALVETQAGSHVFVVGEGNRVESRDVDVVSSYEKQWLIKKGLREGERVIVKGTQKVKPGLVVSPVTAPAPSTPQPETTRSGNSAYPAGK